MGSRRLVGMMRTEAGRGIVGIFKHSVIFFLGGLLLDQ